MNKDTFLQRLRELLAGIPAMEAQEAIQYYEDYFADAGVENEAKVMEELGSPEKVAENIRKDLGYQKNDAADGIDRNETCMNRDVTGGAYREAGAFDSSHAGGGYRQESASYQYGDDEAFRKESASYQDSTYRQQSEKKSHSVGWIVAAICTCWLWVPLLIAFVSVLFGVMITILAVIFAIGVAALAMVIGAIVMVCASLVKLIVSPAGGLLLLGTGLMLGGIAILGIMLVALLFGKAIPGLFRGIGAIWKRMFRRGGSMS